MVTSIRKRHIADELSALLACEDEKQVICVSHRKKVKYRVAHRGGLVLYANKGFIEEMENDKSKNLRANG